MDVAIAGGHGKIALRLEGLLTGQGHQARAIIRNPDHAPGVEAAGAQPVVLDLEALAGVHDLSEAVAGADAVVFAAGAGPGSGPERKRTVDYGGAVKLIAAAQQAGIDRYVMVSSIGADRPEEGRGPMRAYLQAKAEAEGALRATELTWTIVRPVSLTDDPGTGRVRVAEHLGTRGTVSRNDVAAVLATALTEELALRRTVELAAGETPIREALAALG